MQYVIEIINTGPCFFDIYVKQQINKNDVIQTDDVIEKII